MFILCSMNITENWPKIKTFIIQDAALPILVILVGIGSFGLGRMSATEASKEPITVSQVEAVTGAENGRVVVSKSGTKYHFPWCSGASRMKEENKIWFDSYEEARAAGYLPAGNCKGLE
jgi:hypothetical protein